MNVFLLIVVGIVGAFLASFTGSLFVSRSDKWRNSRFQIFLWKLGWWLGGFVFFSGLTYYFFMK
ncbi:MAG: hypothetical protein AB7V36_05800 [Bacteroidales bacterium]